MILIEMKWWKRGWTDPVAEVVGEHQVAGERVGEGAVELEHFQQFVPLDGVQVAVGQRPHVGRWLTHRPFLPERVAEDVAFPCSFTTSSSFTFINFNQFQLNTPPPPSAFIPAPVSAVKSV